MRADTLQLDRAQHRRLLAWAPLLALPLGVMLLRATLASWAFMWLLAFAIYAGCKWQTLVTYDRATISPRLALGYLLLWPGMDPVPFTKPDGGEKWREPRFFCWAAGLR